MKFKIGDVLRPQYAKYTGTIVGITKNGLYLINWSDWTHQNPDKTDEIWLLKNGCKLVSKLEKTLV